MPRLRKAKPRFEKGRRVLEKGSGVPGKGKPKKKELILVTLRIDYSSYLSKIFKARLLHDLEQQPLIRATKETSIEIDR